MAPLNGGYNLDEEEIQFLYENPPQSIRCGMCSMVLDHKTPAQRQAHYDEKHFSQSSGPSKASPTKLPKSPPSKNQKSPNKSWKIGRAEISDHFWYPAHTEPPPRNFTPGLIPILKDALIKSHAKGTTTRAALCYDRAVHVSRDTWDVKWGCGYRNFLMACTALMDQQIQPMYFPLLDHPISPSVRNLQRLIELAWSQGFDEEGAAELKQLVDKKKWIGTSDIWVAFTYCGIPAELVDFNLKKEPRGAELVIEWIVDYFTPQGHKNHHNMHHTLREAPRVISTDRMPLILQHAGHSRTVVGYEVSKKGAVNLLVFDPSHLTDKRVRNVALANLTSNKSSSSIRSHTSAHSKISNFFHSVRDNIDRKRRRSGSSSIVEIDNPQKRLRGSGGEEDDEVMIVGETKAGNSKSSSKENAAEEQLSPSSTLNQYRLDPKKLRKSHYQILYFPLTDPLTEEERLSRRVVTSHKIC